MSESHELSSDIGGKFDFKDGGTYIGEWCDGRAHGYGIATGPNNQGEYSGDWSVGFENCGIYIWPSGNVYEGLWMKGKRHGEGIQIMGRWIYKGCFTSGFFGRYGVKSSLYTQSRYEGCWHLNEFDGYGIETCADGSTYAGMWFKNQRKGLGISRSAPFGVANDFRDSRDSRPSMSDMSVHYGECGESTASLYKDSLNNEIRNGFVLCFSSNKNRSKPSEFMDFTNIFTHKKSLHKDLIFPESNQPSISDDQSRPFKFHKKLIMQLRRRKPVLDQRSSRSLSRQRTSDNNESDFLRNASGSLKSTNSRDHSNNAASTIPTSSGSSLGKGESNSFTSVVPGCDILASIPKGAVESYAGQWNANTRTGLGVAERSDGLKYIGEWLDNKRHGYGITCFPDNTVEEGKYKDNILCQQLNRKSRIFLVKHSRLKNLVDEVVRRALDVAQDAKIKAAETAYQRAQTAQAAAISAQARADDARKMSKSAREIAKQISPNFEQPGPIWELKRKKDEAASRSALTLAKFQVQSPISSLSFDSGAKTFDTSGEQSIFPPKVTQKLYKPNLTPTRSRHYYTYYKNKATINEHDFASEGDIHNTLSHQLSSEFARRPNTRWFLGHQESPYLEVKWSSQKKCSPIDQSPPSTKSTDKFIKIEESNILDVPLQKSKPKLKSFRTQFNKSQEMPSSSKSSHQDSGYYSMEPDSAQLSNISTSGCMSLPSSSFITSQKQDTHYRLYSRNSPIESLNLDHFDQYSLSLSSNQTTKQRISVQNMNRGSSMDESFATNRHLKNTKKNLSHDNSFESEISDIIFSYEHKPLTNESKVEVKEMSKDDNTTDNKRANSKADLEILNLSEINTPKDPSDNDRKSEEFSLSRTQMRSSKRRNPALARSPPAFTHDDESENISNQNPKTSQSSGVGRESKNIPEHIMGSTLNVSRPQRSRIPISKLGSTSLLSQSKNKSMDAYYRSLPLTFEKNEISSDLTIYDLFSLIISACTQYWMLKFCFSTISSLVAAIKIWLEENLSICIAFLINVILVLIFLQILLTKTEKEEQ